ncbi:MAG TPA: hypothetical protein VF219_12245, partial [Vicinamibacterales bacterium]
SRQRSRRKEGAPAAAGDAGDRQARGNARALANRNWISPNSGGRVALCVTLLVVRGGAAG